MLVVVAAAVIVVDDNDDDDDDDDDGDGVEITDDEVAGDIFNDDVAANSALIGGDDADI